MRGTLPLVALLLLAALPHAAAQAPHEVAREVKASVVDAAFEMTAKFELPRAGGGTDTVHVTFEPVQGDILYHFERDPPMNMQAKTLLQFHRFVEFRDSNGDGTYHRQADVEIMDYPVGELRWSIDQPVAVDGGYRVDARGLFSWGGGFGVSLYAYGEEKVVNGTTLRPSDVQVDLTVENFYWDEYLLDTDAALLLQYGHEEERTDGDDTGEGSGTPRNAMAAYYRWSDRATVDGAPGTVRAQEEGDSPGESRGTMSFTYPRSELTTHTTVLGIEPLGAGGKGMPFPAVVALVGVALAALALRRRA